MNFLDDHPEGLGKHINVKPFELQDVDLSKLEDHYQNRDIPTILEYITRVGTTERYFMLISSDLTCCFDDKWDFLGTKLPTLDMLQFMLNGLTFYTNQVYAHLNIDVSNLKVYLIGNR